MTPKERAAMQQALMYLEAIVNGEDVKPYQCEGTVLTLREALEQPVSQEPVAWMNKINGFICKEKTRSYHVPLYAAPVRTKDLTDDELREVLDKHCCDGLMPLSRAVIAADREKNK